MSSPVLWGPNNISNSLQNKFLMANGAQLANDGVKNYLTYGNFENGLTTGWSLSHTTLSSNVPNQASASWTSANANLSISTVYSGQLAGNYSLSLASSAATTAGDMLVSQAYTIDIEDQGKVQSLKFYYSAITNSSNNNFSGTVSNTWQPYIYDSTNNVWIQPTGVYSISQGSGVGYSYCQWQMPSNMTQFRVAIVCINASAGATTLYFYDLACGPSQYVYGTPVTDWQSYTPIFGASWGTVAGSGFYSRRVGANLQVKGWLQCGTPTATASTTTISIPSGLAIDTTKVVANQSIGKAETSLSSTTFFHVTPTYNNTAGTGVMAFTAQTSTLGGFAANVGASTFMGTNGYLTVDVDVPITGWSSTTQTSDTNWPNVVVARYTTSTARTVNNTSPVIIYETKDFDNTGIYNTATGVGTIQSPGWYQFQGCFYATGVVQVAGYAIGTLLAKNGSNNQTLAMIRAETTASVVKQANGSCLQYFNAGDTFSILGYADAATSLVASVPTSNYFSIEKVQGPTTISLTETVAATYTNTSGQTITTGSPTTITNWTKVYDTNAIFNSTTGIGTIPNPGKYRLTAAAGYSANLTANASTSILKNGSSIAQSFMNPVNQYQNPLVTITYNFNAGDTFQFQTTQNSGSNKTLQTDGTICFMCIERVGN
jgi:hypothetical protein